MADVQQMLWAPVNFIIGVARGSARLVQGAAPATVENEIADEEATVDAQPLPSTRTQLNEQQVRSHAWAHEGQKRIEEASDQRVHKAAIVIPVEVEDDSEDRETRKEAC